MMDATRTCIGCDTDEDKVNVVELDLKDKGIVCENCMLLYSRVENVVSRLPRCRCGAFGGGDGDAESPPPYVCEKCKVPISLSCHYCMGNVSSPHYHIVDAGTYPVAICQECKDLCLIHPSINLAVCSKSCNFG
jgi:hypothetical protein